MTKILKIEIYKVIFDKKVLKFLSKHKWENIIYNFQNALKIIKINPYENNLDIKTMKWKIKSYRLRIWKYRFIYEIIDNKLIITFVDADTRWDIY